MTGNANLSVFHEIVNKIDAIFEKIDEKQGWLSCPACLEEWSALRTCRYSDEGKSQSIRLCPNCAESPAGLTYMADKLPCGLQVTSLPAVSRRSIQAVVRYGDGDAYRVWVDGAALRIRRFGPGAPMDTLADNVASAYIAIREAVRNGGAVGPDSDWGSPKSKFERPGAARRGLGRRQQDQSKLL